MLAEVGDPRVVALSPLESKGLEYDAVIVVEPDRIVTDTLGGIRALYVVLTRATQRMITVNSTTRWLPSDCLASRDDVVDQVGVVRGEVGPAGGQVEDRQPAGRVLLSEFHPGRTGAVEGQFVGQPGIPGAWPTRTTVRVSAGTSWITSSSSSASAL